MSTGGKRGPSAPLVTSDEEESPDKGTDSSLNASSTDYDNVSSPCSSTASGPVYVRKPGFTHHAHQIKEEVVKQKVKKKKTVLSFKDSIKKRDQNLPKSKPKRSKFYLFFLIYFIWLSYKGEKGINFFISAKS